MAAEVYQDISSVEHVVTRWIVDFYSALALDYFKNDKYKEFCAITSVLDSVLVRPLESAEDMSIKIRIMQFLSRINEGEKLDVQFEVNNQISPLESALILLESMIKDFSIEKKHYQNVLTSLKEMTVAIFITKNEFDKAKEVLEKCFPKDAGGKRAVFMKLICQESREHKVIKQMNFHQFKQEVLAFCQTFCSFEIPFLYKAAEKLVATRLETKDKAATVDECNEPGPSSTSQGIPVQSRSCKQALIQRTRLLMAFNALSGCSDEKPFTLLEQEVEEEGQEIDDVSSQHSTDHNGGDNLNSEQDGLYQRDSCSPMEASPADQQQQTDAKTQTQADSMSKVPYTVARLVVEPDSQASSQCTTAPEELETEVRTEKPTQMMPTSSKKHFKDMECPLTIQEVSIPIRKLPKRTSRVTRASTSMAECSTDSEDDSSASATNCNDNEVIGNQSNRSLSRNPNGSTPSSSESEENTQELLRSCQKPRKRQLRSPTSNDPGDADDITDDSPDKLHRLSPRNPVPQKSSTPHKDSSRNKGPRHLKFKSIVNNVTESKEIWDDVESYFPSKKDADLKSSNNTTLSNSGSKRRLWTESETQKLIEGVRKFGEGNWRKIKVYYSFKERTNVNLKDRWRTLKRLNMT